LEKKQKHNNFFEASDAVDSHYAIYVGSIFHGKMLPGW